MKRGLLFWLSVTTLLSGFATAQEISGDYVITTKIGLTLESLKNSGIRVLPDDPDLGEPPLIITPPSTLPLPRHSVLPVIIEPDRPPDLPPGVVLAPKPLKKEDFDSTRGRLLEEKIKVLEESGIPLTAEQTISVRTCQGALTLFETARRAYSVASGENEASALKDLLAAEQQLEADCVSTVADATQVEAFGILETPKLGIVCGALLLTSNRIATAYHCLIRTDVAFEEITFRALSEPKRTIKLDKPVFFPNQQNLLPEEAGAVENDFIGADLKETVAIAPRLCLNNVAVAGDQLALIAYWPFASTGQILETSVRQEKTGGCIALRTGAGCFAHSCSAVPNQSGSPIFGLHRADCDGAVVLGLHVNGSALTNKACGSQTTNSAVSSSRVVLLGTGS